MLNLRKINARYEYDAEDRASGMFGSTPRTAAEMREARLTLPANMQQPMPIHRAIMEQVDTILSVGLTDSKAAAEVAMPLRAAMRLLRRLEPLMLEHLATVPEE